MPVIVSFVSQKGGVGKSTLARALVAVASRVVRARIADLDWQQTSATEWKHARERNDGKPAFEVVPYRSPEEAIAQADDVELLIIDAPAHASPDTLKIARHSHLVVQPTGASFDDLRPAVLTFHELVRAGVPKERLVMAISRILSEGEEVQTRRAIEEAGYQALDGAITERTAYRAAQNRGQAITETKSAKLNRRADLLMESLVKKVLLEVKAQRVARLRGTKTA